MSQYVLGTGDHELSRLELQQQVWGAVTEHFLDRLHIPVVAHLRDTQHYLQAVERGVGVHELDAPRALKDRVPWQEMLRWVEGIGSPKFALVPPPKAIPDAGASRAARAQSPARGNP